MIGILVIAFVAGAAVRAADLEAMSATIKGRPLAAAALSLIAWACAVGGYALALATGSLYPLIADGVGYAVGAWLAACRARASR